MTGVPIKRMPGEETDTGTEETPGEDAGRDRSAAVEAKTAPKIANKPPEARVKAWDRFFLTALTRKQSYRQLDLGHLASRTVR
jgi:hypothetical protein